VSAVSSERQLTQAAIVLDAKDAKQPQSMTVLSTMAVSSHMDEVITQLYNKVQAMLKSGKLLEASEAYDLALLCFKRAAEQSCKQPALQALHDEAFALIGRWYAREIVARENAHDHEGAVKLGADLILYFYLLGMRGSNIALRYADSISTSIRPQENDDRKQAAAVSAVVEASSVEQQILERAKAAVTQRAAFQDGKDSKEAVSQRRSFIHERLSLIEEKLPRDPMQILDLAMEHFHGFRVPQSYARAYELFRLVERLSCDRKEPALQALHIRMLDTLGECYLIGCGVPKSWYDAVEYFDRAAREEGYSDQEDMARRKGCRFYLR
jgi:TPR repeat protein